MSVKDKRSCKSVTLICAFRVNNWNVCSVRKGVLSSSKEQYCSGVLFYSDVTIDSGVVTNIYNQPK